MNTPTTSKPCCFNSHAATEESTPPDIPTITRVRRNIRSRSCDLGNKSDRPAPPRAVVVDTAKYERAPMSRFLSHQIFVAQPQRPDDADIERPLRVLTPRVRRKRKADERRLALRGLPTINTDERSGCDVPPRLLERFPDRSRSQRLL